MTHYDSEALEQYRRKAAELGQLRKEIGERIGELNPSEAQKEFDRLVLRTKELEELRAGFAFREARRNPSLLRDGWAAQRPLKGEQLS
jgi:hypothetical protein